MNTSLLFQNFPDESACIQTLKEKRLQIGVVCKKCSHTEHYFRKGDLKFECKKCKSRQSIRTGTVMENSNLPFRYWMLCLELMTLTKKSFSALEMQRLIGHKRYEPIWYMMHKIRRVMGKRDDIYQLSDYVEMDEGFFERVDDKEVIKEKKENSSAKPTKLKRGRGSERQTKVLVMVESKQMGKDAKKGKPDRKVGYLKMKVMEDLKAETIKKVVESNIEKVTEATTDGYRGYGKLKSILAAHKVIIEPDKMKSEKLFPCANRTIRNAKKALVGIHHNCINSKFMQNYLDEFCYKFNRRYFGEKLSDRLILAAIQNTWY